MTMRTPTHTNGIPVRRLESKLRLHSYHCFASVQRVHIQVAPAAEPSLPIPIHSLFYPFLSVTELSALLASYFGFAASSRCMPPTKNVPAERTNVSRMALFGTTPSVPP